MVDYQIEMPHSRKKRQIFHVNLIKKCEPPSAINCVAFEEGVEDDFPEWRGSEKSQPQPTCGATVQREELNRIQVEFDDVLRGKPGQTHVVEHSIKTEARPIRQAPYRIPQAYREEVQKELKETEESGVIEPSHSECMGFPECSQEEGWES